MKSIAIIGIGNLGLRHLESLYNSNQEYRIYAIDKSEESIINAKKYLSDLNNDNNDDNIFFFSSINKLPKYLDLVIISTNSNVRFNILKSLVDIINIKFLILEKILFQKLSDYYDASNLIQKKNIITYVNCPMRLYNVYKEIKLFTKNRFLNKMTVSGCDWDLACNSIHYVDLHNYFTNQFIVDYDFNLDNKIIKSKRLGFVEFTGRIFGKSKDSFLTIQSDKNNNNPKKIILEFDDLIIKIYESKKYYEIYNCDKIETYKFNIPYQSQLTHQVVNDLFNNNKCYLSKYNLSLKLHIPLIKNFILLYNKKFKNNHDYIPIT